MLEMKRRLVFLICSPALFEHALLNLLMVLRMQVSRDGHRDCRTPHGTLVPRELLTVEGEIIESTTKRAECTARRGRGGRVHRSSLLLLLLLLLQLRLNVRMQLGVYVCIRGGVGAVTLAVRMLRLRAGGGDGAASYEAGACSGVAQGASATACHGRARH